MWNPLQEVDETKKSRFCRSLWRQVGLASALWAFAVCTPTAYGVTSTNGSWHYHYFKEPRPLTLDADRIAIRHAGTVPATNHLMPLAKLGVRITKEETWPSARWSLVSGLTRSHAPAGRRELLRQAAEAEEFEYVAPVFLDKKGDPLLFTTQIFVGFNPGLEPSQAEAILGELRVGAFTLRNPGTASESAVYQVDTTLKDGARVLDLANSLAQSPQVRFAEPGLFFIGVADLIPTDPMFGQSWGLHSEGDVDMDAPEAWDITTGDPAIIVAVLDSGVQQDHPDVNQIPGTDVTDDPNSLGDGGPVGLLDNHGTAVAGCISGRINNDLGTVGIAPSCRVVSVRIGKDYYEDPQDRTVKFTTYSEWLDAALNWADSHGARVSNNSNSGFADDTSMVEEAYERTRSRGMVHFASAGNDAASVVDFPARLDSVNAVGAVDLSGARATFSNWGQALDFCAPGVAILSTDRTGADGYHTSSDYDYVTGTSFASPYAAGVAALILSIDTNRTPTQVEDIMRVTCEDLGASGWDETFGWGLVNANRAVRTSAVGTFTLTVQSSGAAGVVISASVADMSARRSGTTPFTLRYVRGTNLVLYAPLQVGAARFMYWTGGVFHQNGNYAAVQMDGDKTVTAVYEPGEAQPGSDLTLVKQDWDDDRPGGDQDNRIEAGERVRLRIRLQSINAVSLVEGSLSTSVPGITLVDNEVDFPDFSAGEEQWSSGAFDLDLNVGAYADAPFTLHLTYRRDGATYFQDLPFTKDIDAPADALFSVTGIRIDDSRTVERPFNNGDQAFQSGEDVRVFPTLRNIGVGLATGIRVWLENTNAAIEILDAGEQNAEGYPDLGPDAEAEPAGGDEFRVYSKERSFTGRVTADVYVRWDQSEAVQILKDGLELTIGPAPWLRLSEYQWDFGLATPGDNVSHKILVQNAGSGPLSITNITLPNPDTTCPTTSTSPLPWILAPGESKEVTFAINTTGLLGQVSREIMFVSDSRVRANNANIKFVISGLVSEATAVGRIPESTAGEVPDISGSWIVWDDYGHGTADIVVYNLMTGQTSRITTNPANKYRPRISGDLIVWTDSRNPGSRDVYAYDLTKPALGEFPVPSTSSDERVIGVSGNLVALRRVFWTTPEPGNRTFAENLVILEYDGNGHFTPKFDSGFAGNPDHQPIETIDDGDFRDGMLVVECEEMYWNLSEARWVTRDSHLEVIDFGAGESLLRRVTNSQAPRSLSEPLAPAAHRFAFSKQDANGHYQIHIWHANDTVEQITSFGDLHPAESVVGIGGADGSDLIVYDYGDASRRGLYFLDRSQGNLESVILPESSADFLRMDGSNVVWFEGQPRTGIWYALLKQPDVAVLPGWVTVSPSSPFQGEPFTVTVQVRNITDYAQPSDVTVALQDAEGTLLAPAQVITGGLGAKGSSALTFTNVTIISEGTNSIFVHLSLPVMDGPANNIASIAVEVQDSDTDGPIIADFVATERNGDGDGIIGSDEPVLASWTVSDATGVGSLSALLDGVPVPTTITNGTSYAALPPQSEGLHELEIRATDNDISPAASTNRFMFPVVRAERISVRHNDQTVPSGGTQPVDLGTFELGAPAESLFVAINDGQQSLVLGTLTVSGPLDKGDFSRSSVAPGGFATFALKPNTSTPGSFTGSVSLTSSDAMHSPYDFPVAFSVAEARPTLNLARQGDSLVFSWPTNAGAFSLEYALDLPATNWLSDPTIPVIVGAQKVVISSIIDERRFFRLRKP